MVGGKRRAAVEEDVLEVGRERALPAGDPLQGVVHTDGIDHRFGGEDSGFASALVVGNVSPKIQGTGHSGSRGHARVGGEIQRMLIVQAHGVGTLRIGDEQSGGNSAHGHQPLGVDELETERTGPDGLLVLGEVDEEFAFVGMRNGAVGQRRGLRRCGLRRSCGGRRRLLGDGKPRAGNQEGDGEEQLG